MNAELSESKFVIAFSQGDTQQEYSHEKNDKRSTQLNIPTQI